MKNIFKMLSLVLLLGISACHDYVEDMIPNQQEDEVPKKTIVLVPLAEKVMIKDLGLIGEVKDGQILEIEIRGKKTLSQYSEMYGRNYQSFWTERVRVPDGPRRMISDRASFSLWEDIEVSGQCQHFYRDELADVDTPLVFDTLLEEVNLRIKVGQNIYPIGEVIQNDVTSLKTRFRFSKEMLDNADDAYLYVLPDESESIRLGFLGLGTCEGQGKRDFHTNGPKNYHEKKRGPRFEYEVTVNSVEGGD